MNMNKFYFNNIQKKLAERVIQSFNGRKKIIDMVALTNLRSIYKLLAQYDIKRTET